LYNKGLRVIRDASTAPLGGRISPQFGAFRLRISLQSSYTFTHVVPNWINRLESLKHQITSESLRF